ncbi:MAG: hypothetical protein FD174_3413 [Geobacteraceae bacterium]|nr:MAG: hypothetical protein FD174_3413 [Geobacteraceae bacterium]
MILRERRTVMRKIVLFAIMAAFVAAVSAPITVQAAEKVKGEVVMKVGNKVNLFHSGTADVKKEICLGDVIAVYRETGGAKAPKSTEVGAVKVTGYAGEHYFEAEIVKGEIKPGDIAMKKGAYCLVTPR